MAFYGFDKVIFWTHLGYYYYYFRLPRLDYFLERIRYSKFRCTRDIWSTANDAPNLTDSRFGTVIIFLFLYRFRAGSAV